VILALDISMQQQINRQKEITFYSLRSGFVIEQLHGRNATLYIDSVGLSDQQTYDYNIKNNHIQKRIHRIDTVENVQFMQCHGKNILVLNQSVYSFPVKEKLKADYVLFNGNTNLSIENLRQMIDFDMLIIGNNCSYYRREALEKACAERLISFHDLKQQGALVVRLKQ
jgi:hypothetical protein